MMRRLVFTTAAVLVSLGVAGAPATAAAGARPDREVSGPFTGTSVFDVSTSRCSFVHQVYDATYATTTKQSGSFHLDGCVDSGSADFAYTGTFVLTNGKRATVEGTVTGVVGGSPAGTPCPDPSDFASPLDFTLTPTRATKNLKRTSAIHLTGVWCSPGAPGVPGGISGTLAGAPI